MSEQNHDITSFDSFIQDNQLHILKTALPYINISEQRFLSVYVKLLELKNTIHFYQSDEETLSACSLQKKDGNLFEFLQDIRKYCPPDKQEFIDQMLNFSNMYQMFQTYQAMSQEFEQFKDFGNDNYNETSNKHADNNDTVNYLKNMLSPEQRGMLEMLMSNNK